MTDLYDTDFFAWTQQQAAALAAGKASDLDWANLAEEIESLGKHDRREIRNRLRVLVRHLLKWEYQPELRGTTEARQAARFMLVHPPVPFAARPAYGVLAAAAVGLLPWWTRLPLRLPYLPLAERTVVRAAGDGLTRTIRWALTSPTLAETGAEA